MTDKQDLAADPIPPKPPAIVRNLMTLGGVAKEMSKVYRDARRGRIPTDTATRLVYCLDRLGRVLELSQIEARLDRLEEKMEGDK